MALRVTTIGQVGGESNGKARDGLGIPSRLPAGQFLLLSLPPLDTREGGQAVPTIVRRHHADEVVIDTTSRVVDGPKNDADTVRAFYINTGINTGLPLKAEGCDGAAA